MEREKAPKVRRIAACVIFHIIVCGYLVSFGSANGNEDEAKIEKLVGSWRYYETEETFARYFVALLEDFSGEKKKEVEDKRENFKSAFFESCDAFRFEFLEKGIYRARITDLMKATKLMRLAGFWEKEPKELGEPPKEKLAEILYSGSWKAEGEFIVVEASSKDRKSKRSLKIEFKGDKLLMHDKFLGVTHSLERVGAVLDQDDVQGTPKSKEREPEPVVAPQFPQNEKTPLPTQPTPQSPPHDAPNP